MRRGSAHEPAALGLRVKSGWAAIVLLAGPRVSPRLLRSGRIELCDAAVPNTRQPYHDGFGVEQRDAAKIRRLVAIVRRVAKRAVSSWLQECRDPGSRPRRAVVVTGSDVDPKTIANPHIRAHAYEGRLFPTVAAEGLRAARVSCRVIVERDLPSVATKALGRSEARLRAAIAGLGRGVEGPWRAEEKAAAMGAWLALAPARPPGSQPKRAKPRHPSRTS